MYDIFNVFFSLPLVPKHPEKAFPDNEDAAAGTVVPPADFGIPLGTMEPFWIPLRRSPFVFPTKSPWFIIPGERDAPALEMAFNFCFSLIVK